MKGGHLQGLLLAPSLLDMNGRDGPETAVGLPVMERQLSNGRRRKQTACSRLLLAVSYLAGQRVGHFRWDNSLSA